MTLQGHKVDQSREKVRKTDDHLGFNVYSKGTDSSVSRPDTVQGSVFPCPDTRKGLFVRVTVGDTVGGPVRLEEYHGVRGGVTCVSFRGPTNPSPC